MGIFDMFKKKKDFGADPGLAGMSEAGMPAADPGMPEGDAAFGPEPGLDMGAGLPGETPRPMGPTEPAPQAMPQQPMPTGAPPSPQPAFAEQQQFTQSTTMVKDMEIISAKLDSIRATIENINQRIAHLEKIAAESQHEEKTY